MKYKHALFLNPYIEKATTSIFGVFPSTGLEYVATSAKGHTDKLTLLDLRYEEKLSDTANLIEFVRSGVDIICGLPGQDARGLTKTLDKVIGLAPEHISVYGLTIENGTPYGAAQKDGALILPGEETERALYLMAIERLTGIGYHHYELSNFAVAGKESRHNSRYWNGGDYIGLGASAHSFISRPGFGRRWWNVRDTEEYMGLIRSGKPPVAGSEELTKEEAATEAIMLGLRQSAGIDEKGFKERFAISPEEHISRKDLLKEQGLIRSENGRMRLTREGILLANEVY